MDGCGACADALLAPPTRGRDAQYLLLLRTLIPHSPLTPTSDDPSFVDDLHAATPLLAYTLTGMALSFGLTMLLRVFRHPLFGGDDCCGRNMPT